MSFFLRFLLKKITNQNMFLIKKNKINIDYRIKFEKFVIAHH